MSGTWIIGVTPISPGKAGVNNLDSIPRFSLRDGLGKRSPCRTREPALLGRVSMMHMEASQNCQFIVLLTLGVQHNHHYR